jgi:hypothetical protein
MLISCLYRTSAHIAKPNSSMQQKAALSYSAVAKSSANAGGSNERPSSNPKDPDSDEKPRPSQQSNQPRRSPLPSQQPKTQAPDENTYILTLLTDAPHHNRMTALRRNYFPKHLNKLEAHITLFHALPESKLHASVVPHVKAVASETRSLPIVASRVERLGKGGIAIFVPKNSPGDLGIKKVYRQLQGPWRKEGWLSVQDSAKRLRPHYTVMNKVEDESQVEVAVRELEKRFAEGGDEGVVEGLGLWRYERGWWKWVEGFRFDSGGKGGGGDNVS